MLFKTKKWIHSVYDNFGGGGVGSYWVGFNDTPEHLNGRLVYGIRRSNQEEGNDWIEAKNEWIRQDDSKVYYYDRSRSYLLYEFSLQIGDRYSPYDGIDLEVINVEYIELLNGEWRKTIELSCDDMPDFKYIWINGVGDKDFGLLSPLLYCSFDYDIELRCHYESNDLLYVNPRANNCWLTGVDDLPIVKTEIFPNPSSEIITLSIEVTEKANGFIYAFDGSMVKSFVFNQNDINISDLSQGMYLLNIIDKNHSYVGQFINE